jgi:hypothetical protein
MSVLMAEREGREVLSQSVWASVFRAQTKAAVIEGGGEAVLSFLEFERIQFQTFGG